MNTIFFPMPPKNLGAPKGNRETEVRSFLALVVYPTAHHYFEKKKTKTEADVVCIALIWKTRERVSNTWSTLYLVYRVKVKRHPLVFVGV